MTINEMMFVAQAAPAGAGGGDMFGMLFPMVIIFAILYFMMIRPQQRKEKERKVLIDGLKSGERVMFCGGIIGTVSNVKEQTFVIKIADNCKVEVAKGAVTTVLGKDDDIKDAEKK